MTTQEFKKKIYDTVEPLLDGQGQVHFSIGEYAMSTKLSLIWYDTRDHTIATVELYSLDKEELFGYRVESRYDADEYDKHLEWLIQKYTDYNCELGHFFEDWTGVEKVLQTFTEYLVKEFN